MEHLVVKGQRFISEFCMSHNHIKQSQNLKDLKEEGLWNPYNFVYVKGEPY